MSSDGAYCPYFHHTIEVIGRRWTGAVILALSRGCGGFGELRAAIPGISDRLLAERLRELEEEGMVDRTSHGRSTIYRLTEKGADLQPILDAVSEHARTWASG